jgi:hypothetical protein
LLVVLFLLALAASAHAAGGGSPSADLDFAGQSVGGVSVDGARASWRRDGEELVITARRPLPRGGLFVVRVSHFVAVPTEPGDGTASTAFFIHADGSATAGQPDTEHFVFPSTDHPRDKASFTFRFDVPAGTIALANGLPLGHWTRNGRTRWLYAERHPMATELTQLAVGNLEFSSPGQRPGILLTYWFDDQPVGLATRRCCTSCRTCGSATASRPTSGETRRRARPVNAAPTGGRAHVRAHRARVYGTKTPPMPGHPDWKADPVQEPAPTARAFAPAPRPRR